MLLIYSYCNICHIKYEVSASYLIKPAREVKLTKFLNGEALNEAVENNQHELNFVSLECELRKYE